MIEVTRTDIINYFIKRYGYNSYLEIGVLDTRLNFDKIMVSDKEGVDPETHNIKFRMGSDDFFNINTRTFDVIFVDAYHEENQLYKDIYNSLRILNEGGVLILHDCNPTEEIYQSRTPAPCMPWTGDCWKAFVRFRQENSDYMAFVINTDFGMGIIKKTSKPILVPVINEDLSYFGLEKNRKEWLNLIEVGDLNETLIIYEDIL